MKKFLESLFGWHTILVSLTFLMVVGVFMLGGCTLHSSISDRGLTLSVLKNADFE